MSESLPVGLVRLEREFRRITGMTVPTGQIGPVAAEWTLANILEIVRGWSPSAGGGGGAPSGAAGGSLSGTYPNPGLAGAVTALFPTADEKAALDGAASPNGGNPFATMADVGTPFDPDAIAAELIPATDGAYNIGSEALGWAAVYSNGGLFGRSQLDGVTNIQLVGTGLNAANDADRVVVDPNGAGVKFVGAAEFQSYIQLDSFFGVAQSGDIRFGNGATIMQRNALNDGDEPWATLGLPIVSDTEPATTSAGVMWLQKMGAAGGFDSVGLPRWYDPDAAIPGFKPYMLASWDEDFNIRAQLRPFYDSGNGGAIQIQGFDADGVERSRLDVGIVGGDTMEFQTFDAMGQQRNDLSFYDTGKEFNHLDADGNLRSRLFAGDVVGYGEGGAGLESRDAAAVLLARVAVSNFGVDINASTGLPVAFNADTVVMGNLPAADPAAAGQVWNNSGVLMVSAG